MGEIFFVLKTLLITVVIVTCLQIKVGRKTIEERSISWLHQSVAIDALRGVADGAVVAIGNGYIWSKKMIDKQLGSHLATPKDIGTKVKEWESEVQTKIGEEID